MQQPTIPQEFLEVLVTGMGLISMKNTGFVGNFVNDTGNAPGQLRCLKGHLRLVNLTEIPSNT